MNNSYNRTLSCNGSTDRPHRAGATAAVFRRGVPRPADYFLPSAFANLATG